MKVIAYLLFVVLIIVSSANKNKKKGKAGAGQQNKPGAAADQPNAAVNTDAEKPLPPAQRGRARPVAPAAAVQAGQALPRRMEPVLASAESAEGRPMLMDEDCRGGSMPHVHAEGHSGLADEDCFGGSMAHTHTEGVSRSDHARRMADIDARQHENDVLPQTIDARALRRAVVMAEVLGRPRALQPRRRVG